MNNVEAVDDFMAELGLRGCSKNTMKAYRITVERTLDFCGKDYDRITTQDLKQFLLHLQREKECSLRSIHRHINALRTFYRLFDMSIADKIKLPRVEKTLPTFLNMGEMKKLLDSIEKKRDLAIVRLLYASGLRVSELVALDIDDIEGSMIQVKAGKGKKDRIVYIDDGTLELLRKYAQKRKDTNNALFINRRGKRLTARHIEKMVKSFAKQAGIKKKVTPHTLRHTFATHMLQNQANIMVIKELLGHASLQTTQIYMHVTDEHKKETYMNSHPLMR